MMLPRRLSTFCSTGFSPIIEPPFELVDFMVVVEKRRRPPTRGKSGRAVVGSHHQSEGRQQSSAYGC